MTYKTKQKLERLHVFKRLLAIEKRLDELGNKWNKFPTSNDMFGMLAFGSIWGGGDNTTDAADILTRIREIYDFLSVERKTSASVTKLHKKAVKKSK